MKTPSNLPHPFELLSKLRPLTTDHRPLFFFLLPTALCLLPTLLLADTPSISYIFPAGGQRGSSVAFHVGGHYLHEVCPFEMLGPGVEATPQLHRAPRTVWFEGPRIPMPYSQQSEDYPKDQAGAVTIAPDAPLGIRRFRVWTSQGGAPSMKFVVGDLPEIVEREIDGAPIPTAVKLPITINGRIFPREDVDIWTFSAQQGKTYTLEVMAARLGSGLDSRLEVLGPQGEQIAENVDGRGADSFLQFTAPVDGEYQVKIHDINFGGLQHFVYRLTIHDGPYVNHVYPLGGRRGEAVRLELDGVNLPQRELTLMLPNTDAKTLEQRLEIGDEKTNDVSLQLNDWPEQLEQEPNETPETAQELSAPGVGNGRIDRAGDVDCWTFQSSKDEEIVFQIYAARLGARLDSVLEIQDQSGKTLVENDNLAGDQTDSKLTFKCQAEGTYTVVVRERAPRRGGVEFGYRLHVTPRTMGGDFQLHLNADTLTLNRESEGNVSLEVERTGGFNEPIELNFEGLPAEVTVSETTIPAGKNKADVKIKAEKSAKIAASRLKITGTAKIGEEQITRMASTKEAPALDHLFLVVALPTPFKILGKFETNYVARGATYFRHYSIDRGGFEGPLEVRLADRQVRHLQGITGPTVVVPPGETEFDYKIKLPPWMQPARTSRTVVVAVGVITEPDGTQHKVSYSSPTADDQIIMMVTTGELSVDVYPKTILAKPKRQAPLTIKVGRGQSLTGPVKLELVVPEHIHGVTAESVILPPEADEIAMRLEFSDNEIGPFNMPLVIRATTQKEGQPYTAECPVEILMDQ